jgi:hypothetical protein
MLDAHACMHGHILALIKLPLRTAMLASCILAVYDMYTDAYYFMGNKQRILTHTGPPCGYIPQPVHEMLLMCMHA